MHHRFGQEFEFPELQLQASRFVASPASPRTRGAPQSEILLHHAAGFDVCAIHTAASSSTPTTAPARGTPPLRMEAGALIAFMARGPASARSVPGRLRGSRRSTRTRPAARWRPLHPDVVQTGGHKRHHRSLDRCRRHRSGLHAPRASPCQIALRRAARRRGLQAHRARPPFIQRLDDRRARIVALTRSSASISTRARSRRRISFRSCRSSPRRSAACRFNIHTTGAANSIGSSRAASPVSQRRRATFLDMDGSITSTRDGALRNLRGEYRRPSARLPVCFGALRCRCALPAADPGMHNARREAGRCGHARWTAGIRNPSRPCRPCRRRPGRGCGLLPSSAPRRPWLPW